MNMDEMGNFIHTCDLMHRPKGVYANMNTVHVDCRCPHSPLLKSKVDLLYTHVCFIANVFVEKELSKCSTILLKIYFTSGVRE